MKTLLLIFSLFGLNIVAAQLPVANSAIIDVNNISARFLSDGTISYQEGSIPPQWFEYPKGSGIHATYIGKFWMRALDNNGNLKLAAERYSLVGNDYFFGPVSNVYDSIFNVKYNKVWKVSAAQIDYHKTNLKTLGYVMPDGIATWPAHGDVSKGQAANLAPYFDFNGDGFYTPLQGDYPLILGDEALYIMFNDDRLPHTETGGAKLGAEIHMMVYGFNQPANPVVNDALFLNLRIYNRSTTDLNSFKLSWFNDFDLGNFNNDRMGCDTTTNTYFSYNGSVPDNPQNGLLGYDSTRVALGATMLNTSLESFICLTNGFILALTDPQTAVQYNNFMNSSWYDGSPYTYGGIGHASSSIIVDHLFSGDPCNSSEWSDATSGFFPEDRRGAGTTGAFNFPAGAQLSFDLAYSFAIGGSTDTCLASGVTALKQTVPQLKDFYIDNNLGVLSPILSSPNLSSITHRLLIYPNPTQNLVTIEWQNLTLTNEPMMVIDMMGRKVLEHKLITETKTTLDVSSLSEGVYWIVAATKEGLVREKMVVQR